MVFMSIQFIKIKNMLPDEQFPYLRKHKRMGKLDPETKILLQCIQRYTQLNQIFSTGSIKDTLWRITAKIFNRIMKREHPENYVHRIEDFIKKKFSKLTYDYRNESLKNKTFYMQSELAFRNPWLFDKEYVLFDGKRSKKVIDNENDILRTFTRNEYKNYMRSILDTLAKSEQNDIPASTVDISLVCDTKYVNEIIGSFPKYQHFTNDWKEEIHDTELTLGLAEKPKFYKNEQEVVKIDMTPTPEKAALIKIITQMNNDQVVNILNQIGGNSENNI